MEKENVTNVTRADYLYYQGKPMRVIGHAPGYIILDNGEKGELRLPISELEVMNRRGVETR